MADNLLESQLKTDDSDLESLASRALNLNMKKLPTTLFSQKLLGAKKEEKLHETLLQIPMARIKVDRTPSDMGSVGLVSANFIFILYYLQLFYCCFCCFVIIFCDIMTFIHCVVFVFQE